MLLLADGFDHYGTGSTGRTNMLLGVYSAIDTAWTPATTKPRNSICSMANASSSSTGIRRGFGSALTTVGVGCAFFYTQLPIANTTIAPMVFLDASNTEQVTLCLQSTGGLEVKRGTRTGTSLGATTGPVISSGSWAHIEMVWVASSTISATDGTVTVYVNGTSVLAITGVDNVATSLRECSQVVLGLIGDSTVAPSYIDDLYAWDSSGSYNNSQIGDKDVLPYYPYADTATTDWVRNTGSSDFSAVNQTAQDGDTTYLEAALVDDTEELELSAVPNTVDGIVGVVLVNCLRKTAAGASEVACNIVEDATDVATTNTAHVMTQSYAYYHDVVERNPAVGTPAWTYTTLSSARLKLKRTV